MRKILAIAMVLTLAACSGGGSLGSFNPFGLFKTGQTHVATDRGLAPRGGFSFRAETRPLVPQITRLIVDRTPSGVIIHATATMPSEGYHTADLIFTGLSGGVATYDFRARPPVTLRRQVPAHLRELVVAVHLSRAQLAGIQRIQVQTASNNRSARP